MKEKKNEEESMISEEKHATEVQVEDYVNRIKHLQADFENYKKRVARERVELATIVEDRAILKFIPIYDNLERAFRSFNRNNDKDSFVEGMEKIFAGFRQLLENEGVEPIESLGQQFDPALHEALLAVESAEEPNIILEEFEQGYMRQGRLLRPSRVKVSKSKSESSIKKEGEDD